MGARNRFMSGAELEERRRMAEEERKRREASRASFKRDGGSRARVGPRTNLSTGARGSGLSWSEDGRPYIMENGRRVFAGDAASRYNETPEAAVDNVENLEGGDFYTGNETRQVVVPETPADTRTLDRSPVSRVSAEEALAGFMSKLSSEYGINYGGSGNVSGVPKTMVDTSTGENVSITNGPNAGKTISVNDPDFDEIVSGKKQGGMTEISGVTSKKLADALSDTESLRYNPREGAYEGAGSASDYVLPGLNKGTQAFLDYNGKGGSLMALRARDAARNTLRAGGRDYQIDGDKKATLISREGSEFLRENPGADAASQEFVTNYMKPKVTPSDPETSDVTDPLPASRGDYMRIAGGTPMVTPVVSDQGIPAIDRGTNRSLITGAPSEYGDLNMDFGLNSGVEPPVQGFLPDTQYWDSVRKFYIK